MRLERIETNPERDIPAKPKAGAPSRQAPRAETDSPAGWRHTFSSLSNRDFLFLWLGMLAMMGGMQMQMMARGYLVYDLTGSASLLGAVNAGNAFPVLILSLFGGVVADRVERKRVIQAGQAGAGMLALVIGLLIGFDLIAWWHLLAAAVFQGMLFAFMMPARQAIIPQLVGSKQLTNAMALNAAAMSTMTLAAPAVAGTLYAWVGPDKVYYLIAALGFVSVVMTGMISKVDSGTVRAKAPVFQHITLGLSYIKNNQLVLILLFMGMATSLLAMPFRFLMPVFVVDIYHLGPDSMGLLVAIMGGGSLIGSLSIAALGRWRRGLLLITGAFISGFALMMIAILPFYVAAAVIMIPLGLGDAGRRTLNQALIMEEVEDQYRGRVMSVFMMSFGLMPLGVLPAGLLTDVLGGQVVIAILAVLLLIVSTVVLVTQKRLRAIS